MSEIRGEHLPSVSTNSEGFELRFHPAPTLHLFYTGGITPTSPPETWLRQMALNFSL